MSSPARAGPTPPTSLLLAGLLLLCANAPALGQLAPCVFQRTTLLDELQATRTALAEDAFAEAYGVYLRDLDAIVGDVRDFYATSAPVFDDCARLAVEVERYNVANAEYARSECGAAEAPEEVVSRCLARQAVLTETHRRLSERITAIDRRIAAVGAASERFRERTLPAFEHARTVLDPEQVEGALRLYVSWVQKQGSGSACRDLATVAGALGARVQNQTLFLRFLSRTLAGDAGSFSLGTTGFRPEFQDSSDQTRHAVAYMVMGYHFTGSGAELIAQMRDELAGQRADYLLGVEAGHMGFQLRTGTYDTRDFGGAIRARLCG